MSVQSIWIDCDPGHDDFCALLLAIANKSINIVGISTEAGNHNVKNTSINAVKALKLSKIENNIPIVPGIEKPMLREARVCEEIHGSSGLDFDLRDELPDVDFENDLVHENPIVFMYNSIRDHVINKENNNNNDDESLDDIDENNKITMVTLGCFTNVALLFLVYPDVKKYISKVVSLAGAIGVGNTSPAAEWNVELDPEATKIVFTSGLPIVQIPIEVSHTLIVNEDVINRIKALDSTFSKIMINLLSFFGETYKNVFEFNDGPPLHDPAAIAYVINPGLFKSKLMNVEIETTSQLSAGNTLCDLYNLTKKPKNVEVCLSADVNGFWDLIIESFKTINENYK